ncbi:MAG TPA: AAA family ATPase [Kofleriaceae bacterium]|jgi:predicted ATPase|nr:AAA family ATPase [Kofleriaceae bacterium]
MAIRAEARDLLEEVLRELYASNAFPRVRDFRVTHEHQRTLIDELLEHQYLKSHRPDWVDPSDRSENRYLLTSKGLLACTSETARAAVAEFDSLLPSLQNAYRNRPGYTWEARELAGVTGRPDLAVARTLALFSDLLTNGEWTPDHSGLVMRIELVESVLDLEPLEWPAHDEVSGPTIDAASMRIDTIELTGYRPFSSFWAQPHDLTVIIGANASGKSSLFDFLRFVSFAASNPLPPEIDPRSIGKRLFHTNGPEEIKFALAVGPGDAKLLRYEVEIHGPIGAPKVASEQLATVEAFSFVNDALFVFLSFKNGRGFVRDQGEHKVKRPEWTVASNELALRRALDPTLVTLARFQAFVTAWRFYSGFDVSTSATMRRPVPSEPSPTLAEDGSNLSAVLFSLVSEHPDAWGELETLLRSAVPGFVSLAVKPRGGPGTVMGIWREQGLKDELTLADLSDGTLRFLCWATLCLSPNIPPLICIDEPEIGLHPRVLPALAGVLRLASARSQILVATHSPYFLSQFQLDEIAVMKKEDGKAVFKRPATSQSLRQEIEELGGESLALMHISDELEARS